MSPLSNPGHLECVQNPTASAERADHARGLGTELLKGMLTRLRAVYQEGILRTGVSWKGERSAYSGNMIVGIKIYKINGMNMELLKKFKNGGTRSVHIALHGTFMINFKSAIDEYSPDCKHIHSV